MALFYRADLFEKDGIAIPTTWEEYAAAAEKVNQRRRLHHQLLAERHQLVHRAGLAGRRPLVRQRRQNWTVTLADDSHAEVADYWQDLIDGKLVADLHGFSDGVGQALTTTTRS